MFYFFFLNCSLTSLIPKKGISGSVSVPFFVHLTISDEQLFYTQWDSAVRKSAKDCIDHGRLIVTLESL